MDYAQSKSHIKINESCVKIIMSIKKIGKLYCVKYNNKIQ